jgi:hypothetical protein
VELGGVGDIRGLQNGLLLNTMFEPAGVGRSAERAGRIGSALDAVPDRCGFMQERSISTTILLGTNSARPTPRRCRSRLRFRREIRHESLAGIALSCHAINCFRNRDAACAGEA